MPDTVPGLPTGSATFDGLGLDGDFAGSHPVHATISTTHRVSLATIPETVMGFDPDVDTDFTVTTQRKSPSNLHDEVQPPREAEVCPTVMYRSASRSPTLGHPGPER